MPSRILPWIVFPVSIKSSTWHAVITFINFISLPSCYRSQNFPGHFGIIFIFLQNSILVGLFLLSFYFIKQVPVFWICSKTVVGFFQFMNIEFVKNIRRLSNPPVTYNSFFFSDMFFLCDRCQYVILKLH